MFSVTQRIQMVNQPYGGYLPVKNAEKIELSSENTLIEGESTNPTIIGCAVDYLTRIMLGSSVTEAFRVAFAGAEKVNETKNAEKLAKEIKGLDDKSIIAVCKLAGYDSAKRAGVQAYKDVKTINPTDIDIKNIKEMVNRSINFFNEYGPVVKDGFTFEGGGYTPIISSGDGDFLTKDTLWDFKVSKSKPTSKHSLQILIYYIMGLHSIHSDDYINLKYLGIFNPRLNTIYRFPISEIPKEVIDEVSDEVIGYNISKEITDKKPEIKKSKTKNTEKEGVLSVKDVAQRYGVSENKIRKDCFDLGLPKTKQGNKYVIKEKDLIEWEFIQVYIPIGRNGYQLLPGYLAALKILEAELRMAKENGDKERIKEVKRKISALKAKEPKQTNYAPIGVAFAVFFFIIVLIVIYFLFVH